MSHKTVDFFICEANSDAILDLKIKENISLFQRYGYPNSTNVISSQ